MITLASLMPWRRKARQRLWWEDQPPGELPKVLGPAVERARAGQGPATGMLTRTGEGVWEPAVADGTWDPGRGQAQLPRPTAPA